MRMKGGEVRFRSSILAFGLLLALATLREASPAGAVRPRDVTFFFISDPHVGAEDPKANPPVTREGTAERARAELEGRLALIGKPGPAKRRAGEEDFGAVARPRGLLIGGDLTDNLEWKRFESVFPAAGAEAGGGTIPFFLCMGNHDGPLDGATGRGVVERNRAHEKAGRLGAISENGLHYALNWEGVHLLVLHLCPADAIDAETPFRFGKPGPGSWNDPQGALSFMKKYLRERVGNSGDPVLLLHHYGFDDFSLNDWNWWTPKQRRAMVDAIRDYNVVAILHGHNHLADHYRWPDPQRNPDEVRRLFGPSPPADLRPVDVFSAGRRVWVFRLVGDRLRAAHHNGRDWSEGKVVSIPLAQPGRKRP